MTADVHDDGLGCARGVVSVAVFYAAVAGVVTLALWGREIALWAWRLMD